MFDWYHDHSFRIGIQPRVMCKGIDATYGEIIVWKQVVTINALFNRTNEEQPVVIEEPPITEQPSSTTSEELNEKNDEFLEHIEPEHQCSYLSEEFMQNLNLLSTPFKKPLNILSTFA